MNTQRLYMYLNDKINLAVAYTASFISRKKRERERETLQAVIQYLHRTAITKNKVVVCVCVVKYLATCSSVFSFNKHLHKQAVQNTLNFDYSRGASYQ